jgi:hypothetical protein
MTKTTALLSTSLLLAALVSPVLAEDEPTSEEPAVEEPASEDPVAEGPAEEDPENVADGGTDEQPDYDPQIAETGVEPDRGTEPNQRGGTVNNGIKSPNLVSRSEGSRDHLPGKLIRKGNVFIKINE